MSYTTYFLADINYLSQQAQNSSFPNNQIPVFKPLEPTKTILVSNLPENASTFVLRVFFSNLGCSVQEVTLRAHGYAVVTFSDTQSKFWCTTLVFTWSIDVGETKRQGYRMPPFKCALYVNYAVGELIHGWNAVYVKWLNNCTFLGDNLLCSRASMPQCE